MQQRDAVGVAAQHQGTHPGGAAELVGGHTHRREPRVGESHRNLADGLHGVAVHGHLELGGDRGELLDRHDRADLVVGPHDRHQGDVVVAVQGLAQRGRCHRAVGLGGQIRHLGALVLGQPDDRVEHGVVLDGGGDDAPAVRIGVAASPVDALDGEVVALGAAGGEDDLRRPGAQVRGDALPRLLHPAPGVAPRGVQRGGVADGGQRTRHRLDGSRMHRGGGGVVEVDRAGAHGLSRIPAGQRPPGSR